MIFIFRGLNAIWFSSRTEKKRESRGGRDVGGNKEQENKEEWVREKNDKSAEGESENEK